MSTHGGNGVGDRKMISNFAKFRLLMWKSLLLQYRHKWQTILEIGIFLFFSASVYALKMAKDNMIPPKPKYDSPEKISDLRMAHVLNSTFLYYPKNDVLENLMNETLRSFLLHSMYELEGVNDPKELETEMNERNLIAAIQFDHPANITKLPKNLVYKLRFSTAERYLENQYSADKYFLHKFAPIQDKMARAFIKISCETANCQKALLPEMVVQRYPEPASTYEIWKHVTTGFIFIVMMSFLLPTINTVRYIATEKEKQLKELMKIMGLPCWLHWTTWFVKTMLFMLVAISIFVFLMTLSLNVDWTLLWFFFCVYTIALTTFAFMMSVFFSKATRATTVTGILWFLLYLPYLIPQNSYASKVLTCVFTNSAMAHGINIIMTFNSLELPDGMTWVDFWKPARFEDDLSIGITICFMLATAFVYMLIALYVEKILPGEYGGPEKWNFPFTREFWCGPSNEGIDSAHGVVNAEYFEADPQGGRVGVRVKNLRKVYANKNVAVKGLTLNMFNDQITVLLGHNGAGKTTAMSMLIGMIPPTSGTALINNHDIRKQTQKARGSIGLCPQNNILFDELTVWEHLEFFGRLKGLTNAEIKEEVTKYAQLLDLESKLNAPSSSLSGGMKRKLSIAIALCGQSKVVLCDEPTSGMDPSARRALWDLLQKEKKGRTILLTTHFMDEADVLGDRIAIMAEGELKCYGTPFFLKKRFGSGYHLVCVKNNGCSSNAVTDVLRHFIPEINIHQDVASELVYVLPEEHVDKFQGMFEMLESQQDALRLNSFGVSLSSVEDVFFKIASDSKELANPDIKLSRETGVEDIESSAESTPLLHGLSLDVNQWHAMLKKRFLCWIRGWLLNLVQVVLPLSVSLAIILISEYFESSSREVSVESDFDVSLNSYGDTVSMLNLPSTPNAQFERIFNAYRNLHGQNHQINEFTGDVESKFLELAKTNLPMINSRYAVGTSMNNLSQIIGWYHDNGLFFGAKIVSVDLIHNAMLKAIIGQDRSIHVIDSPIHLAKVDNHSYDQRFGDYILVAKMQIMTMFTSEVISIISSFYIIYCIKERVSKSKHMQLSNGLSAYKLWASSFVFDFVTFVATVLIALIPIIVTQKGWAQVYNLTPSFLLHVAFGFAVLPFIYLLSFIFGTPPSGFSYATVISIFPKNIVLILGILRRDIVDVMDAICLILPHYSLSNGIERQSKNMDPDYGFGGYGIGTNLLYLIISGVLFFITLFLVEFGILGKVFRSIFCRRQPPLLSNESIDNDVNEEKKIVNAMQSNDLQANNLVLRDLSKFYGSFLAVNQLSVRVKSGECFGLLGLNGAGKTSTFKMLTGDESISSGDAFVLNTSLKSNMSKANKSIGYCPQFDALLDDLTVAETIEIFALLRGVPGRNIPALSQRLANDLNFGKHSNKKISELSGGTKRKLSTSIALIGNPDVIYLDEPTTGMDPGAKRHLWALVSRIRSSGKSIVLTSHSMEECEALCTRLAIMVNGEFKCLGSTQHLKNKFSKGFLLTIKLTDDNIDSKMEADQTAKQSAAVASIKNYVQQNFPGSKLNEEYQGLLSFNLPSSIRLKWSSIFGLMQTAKRSLPIEDYSISQTTLEQVFLSFSKHQR